MIAVGTLGKRNKWAAGHRRRPAGSWNSACGRYWVIGPEAA